MTGEYPYPVTLPGGTLDVPTTMMLQKLPFLDALRGELIGRMGFTKGRMDRFLA